MLRACLRVRPGRGPPVSVLSRTSLSSSFRTKPEVYVPELLTVEIQLPEVEELQKLIADGTENVSPTYDEIVKGLEDIELTKEQIVNERDDIEDKKKQIEDFYAHLIYYNVELVEAEKHKIYTLSQPDALPD